MAEDPYVPPEKSVKEVTAVALLLGAALSVVMGAANTYLGLKVGMTVSASIPAAVISMAILRGVLRRGTILENNIVQTMASTGESLAAGAIFTIPALVLIGEWQDFAFWPTTLIVLLGGLLGIVFMVPMRRALIVDRPDLVFPEGVACSEVLIVGYERGAGIGSIVTGLGLGAAFKFLVSGCRLIQGTVEWAGALGRSVVYMGADMSVALLGVGYIVDLPIAALVTTGGVLGWLVAIPLLGGNDPGTVPVDAVWELWSTKVRYIGVGAMLVGGLNSIWNVRTGIKAGIAGLRGDEAAQDSGGDPSSAVQRTQRDMKFGALLTVFIVTTIATFFFYDRLIGNTGVAAVTTVIMVVTAFVFVAVATYIAGLVGSSNSPVSGMTICALLIAAAVLMAFGIRGDSAILATLGVAGVVCCATCTAGDIAQDLKTGQLVGATPARQQWTEMLGAVIPAFFFAPILTLLHRGYGIGTGAPDSLLAPQAALFASLTRGFFGGGTLPWGMIGIGVVAGIGLILVNAVLGFSGIRFRAHVMPVAVGMYLPLSLDIPLLLGGLIRHYCSGRSGSGSHDPGVLFGSGLIAGEALMGIALAIPISLKVAMPDLGGNRLQSLFMFALVVVAYLLATRRGEPEAA